SGRTPAPFGAANRHVAVPRTRNRTLDEEQIALLVDAHDPQVLDRHAFRPHVTRGPHAGEHPRGIRRLADRTWRPMEHRAMGRAAASEVVALHDPLEALALAGADHVDVVADPEDRRLDLVTGGDGVLVPDRELHEPPRRGHTGGRQVPAHRRPDAPRARLLYATPR